MCGFLLVADFITKTYIPQPVAPIDRRRHWEAFGGFKATAFGEDEAKGGRHGSSGQAGQLKKRGCETKNGKIWLFWLDTTTQWY